MIIYPNAFFTRTSELLSSGESLEPGVRAYPCVRAVGGRTRSGSLILSTSTTIAKVVSSEGGAATESIDVCGFATFLSKSGTLANEFDLYSVRDPLLSAPEKTARALRSGRTGRCSHTQKPSPVRSFMIQS